MLFAAAAHIEPIRILLTIVLAALLQLVLRDVLHRIIRRAVRGPKHGSSAEEQKRENTLTRVFQTVLASVIWIIAGIILISELGVNVAALATGAGVVGVIVGLGAQNVIKDYLAGLFIIIENQYRVGDVITLDGLGVTGGVSGTVEDISIRITKLRDLDGKLHFVRNGLAGVVSNQTFNYANVNLDLRVAYESDIDEVEKVINDTGAKMAADEKWQPMTVEPLHFLRLDGFDDSSVAVKCLGRVTPGNQWDIAGEFRRRIKKAFEKAGIDMPLPQVVVHEPRRKPSK